MVSCDRIAGRISSFFDFWTSLTSDQNLLQHVKGVKIPFISIPTQTEIPWPINCSRGEKNLIDKEVERFIQSGIVQKVFPCQGQFISQIFPRPKKSGGVRIILNLCKLNHYVEYEHFKMETLNAVLGLMKQNCFMGSIDLKDAYYSINIDTNFRKFLRFIWDDQLFEFSCLPMGLTCSPRIFTKLLKPLFMRLRGNGHISVYYLDDSWLMGLTAEECLLNLNETAKLLRKCGFLINGEKSCFVPSQKVIFLGLQLNSINMTISLPEDKINKIQAFCSKILAEETFTIRYLAEFIGVLVSSLPGVKNGELYYRYLELGRNEALKLSKGNFDAFTCLDPKAREEVLWWKNNVQNCEKTICDKPPDLLLTCDASQLGWGAVFEGTSTGGLWGPDESELHINVLELKAIEYGLKSFFSKTEQKHIRIRCDNITAISYVNHKGGVKSIQCHEVARNIWEWAISLHNDLSAEHIPGSENVLADKASRVFDIYTEWEVNNEVFLGIIREFGEVEIDLFASRLNKKLPNYVAWKPDPCASFVDAFLLNWTNLRFYAFPPFSLVLKTLGKIDREEATGILVCPLWPTQAWFPKLVKMLIAAPLILPQKVLALPFQPQTSHRQRNLCMMACLLSGDSSKIKAFQATLSRLCVHPGDQVQPNSIQYISRNGYLSVLNGLVIPLKSIR